MYSYICITETDGTYIFKTMEDVIRKVIGCNSSTKLIFKIGRWVQTTVAVMVKKL